MHYGKKVLRLGPQDEAYGFSPKIQTLDPTFLYFTFTRCSGVGENSVL